MGLLTALILSSLVAGAAGVASSAINAKSVSDTNAHNESLAQQANDTEIELANTAHQREVADLKAAGLNPVLSAGGTGAPVSSLHTPTAQAPQYDLSGVSSAANAISNLMLISSLTKSGTSMNKAFRTIHVSKF